MKIAPALITTIILLGSDVRAGEPRGYHVARTVPVPGAGTYYDYLAFDPAARRLYVSFGDHVAVLDGDRTSIVGSLAGAKKVHGIAIAMGRVFVSDGGSDSVRVYDSQTQKQAGEVMTGKNPDAIIYDLGSRQVLAFNHSAGTVTAIDPGSLQVKATIQVPGALEMGRADGKGTVWVNVEDKNELVRIDTIHNTVTAHWPVRPCEEPAGLGFDEKARRLFVGCGNKLLAVLNADTGVVVTTLPIGPGVDGTDFDPARKTVFASCGGDGTLAVIKQEGPDRYTVVAHLPTQARAKTMTLDPKTHRVFLSAATFSAPAANTANPKPRATLVPGSFRVLVVEP